MFSLSNCFQPIPNPYRIREREIITCFRLYNYDHPTIIIANFLCTIFTRFLSPSKDFNPVIIAVNRSKRRTLHRDGHFSPRWNGLGFRYTLETHYSVAKSRASVIVDWLKLFAQPIRTSWRQWPRSKEIENYGYQRGWNPCPFLRSLRFIAVKTRRY